MSVGTEILLNKQTPTSDYLAVSVLVIAQRMYSVETGVLGSHMSYASSCQVNTPAGPKLVELLMLSSMAQAFKSEMFDFGPC